jgi:inhibitor of KinA
MGAEGLLVEFGDHIDEANNRGVIDLDAAVAGDPPPGLIEAVPAYTTLLVLFDPATADYHAVENHVRRLLQGRQADGPNPHEHRVPVCYDEQFGPDLAAAAAALGLSAAELVRLHVGARYRVFMYGFAPGYAYLGGVPERLRLPRKPQAASRVPAGSVMIAGEQCLVTTMAMPSGWWVVGRSPLTIFDPSAIRPFRFDPGDIVSFEPVGADALGALA